MLGVPFCDLTDNKWLSRHQLEHEKMSARDMLLVLSAMVDIACHRMVFAVRGNKVTRPVLKEAVS